jgi:hypothetical protein
MEIFYVGDRVKIVSILSLINGKNTGYSKHSFPHDGTIIEEIRCGNNCHYCKTGSTKYLFRTDDGCIFNSCYFGLTKI